MARRVAPGVAAIAAVALAACGSKGGRQAPAGTPDAAPIAAARDAGAAVVLEERGYVAVIAADRSVDIAPKLPGELVAVQVHVGDQIKAGDVIATLNNRAAREALTMSKAELASARAARSQADVAVKEAERQLEIERKLVEQGTRPARAAEDAQFALDKARAARQRASAAVAEAKARAQTLKRELGETAIRAPFSGTVAMQYRNAGALVGPTIPIIRLISGDALWVRFAVPPGKASAISPGDEVAIDVAGLTEPLAGTVREITPELDPASRMIFVEAELALSDELRDKVRSGMDAWARLANR